MPDRPSFSGRAEKKPYDCFICFRKGSGLFAARLLRSRLESMGLKCYLNPDEAVDGHMSRRDFQALSQAPAVIMLLSGNALDWCALAGDQLASEIEMAANLDKKTFIVRLEGFVWPSHLEESFPSSVRDLVEMDSLMMSAGLVGEVSEKLGRILKGENSENGKPVSHITRFFSRALDDPDAVTSIDMAFHSGTYWSRENDRIRIMTSFLKQGIPMRILVNTEEVAAPLITYMRKPLKRYLPLDEGLAEWAQLAALYPDLIEVRAARSPILHRVYLIRLQDGSGHLSVKNYVYHDESGDGNYNLSFQDEKAAFTLYAREFDYMWNSLSDPIQPAVYAF